MSWSYECEIFIYKRNGWPLLPLLISLQVLHEFCAFLWSSLKTLLPGVILVGVIVFFPVFQSPSRFQIFSWQLTRNAVWVRRNQHGVQRRDRWCIWCCRFSGGKVLLHLYDVFFIKTGMSSICFVSDVMRTGIRKVTRMENWRVCKRDVNWVWWKAVKLVARLVTQWGGTPLYGLYRYLRP